MSDTKTQPRGQQYTPGSDKPRKSGAVRATRMVGNALAKTGEHRITEWLFGVLGVALLAWDVYAMLKHPPAGLVDQIAHGMWALVAISLIPGAATQAAKGIRELGGALGAAWKSKDKDGAA